MSPRSGSSLEAVEPNPYKGAIKFLKVLNIKKQKIGHIDMT